MDLSAFIVVMGLTASFFGFILWMGIHSRKAKPGEEASKISEAGLKKEKLS